ncbi:MAG: tRNA (N6-threonylcarbamoyladenosine(37)-N6)-methyltransferase TrmO [Candidatus Latescibacterota bacterium]|nr:MAG: tRNA (N6-threonylcarbamoyladenosine(37)-N6)-methyltransferase TrmO [Candidatus Latescibacterota bacterium]RKY65620.1 MAG: tRNA (N6-threonylcarbamoyladenosine(37)-N6)-methyltransferase TrmO [Candidatus Latescibacterota bacterium]
MSTSGQSSGLKLEPVGFVRSNPPGGPAEVVIYEEFSEALDGIDGCGHIWVLFWMHRLGEGDRRTLKVHPMGDRNRPKQGVFSLRSPVRPNPIGLTRVRLLRRDGNVLVVQGLDALEGSPVLDIKPWIEGTEG